MNLITMLNPAPETYYIVRDTVFVASESVLRSIHDINSTTALNTDPYPWTISSIFVAIISLVVAVVSVMYAYRTLKSQERTEKNTLQISAEGQRRILLDIIRHLYSNMVSTVAVDVLMKKCDFTLYPSEEHLLKLKVDPNYLHPELFSDKGNEYERLHNLIVLFRNYNIEIETALMHLKDRYLDEGVKKRDMGTLLVKPGLLTERIIEACEHLFDENTKSEARGKIDEEFKKRGYESVSGLPYYNNKNNGFIKSLYANDPDTFLKMLNENVARELGVNDEDKSKIGLISFDRNN